MHHLSALEFHDADHIEGLAVIGHHEFGDPEITFAKHAPHREAFRVRLRGARRLNVVPAADALTRLRIVENCVITVDLVFCREVIGVGCRPVTPQRGLYIVVPHRRHSSPTTHVSPRKVRRMATGRRSCRSKITDRSATIGRMPRPANPEVRKNLLAAGLDLVHARGFAASGVKDITDAAGVPKGAVYAYFPSKEAFAAAILEHYWADIETRLLPILYADGSAQERITQFFHRLADDHEAGDFLLGCLVGNMSLELGGSSELVRAELVGILDRWDGALAACVRSGQQGSGDVRGDLDPGELAAQLIEAWEGAALRGKVTRSRIPYDRFEAVTVPALLH